MSTILDRAMCRNAHGRNPPPVSFFSSPILSISDVLLFFFFKKFSSCPKIFLYLFFIYFSVYVSLNLSLFSFIFRYHFLCPLVFSLSFTFKYHIPILVSFYLFPSFPPLQTHTCVLLNKNAAPFYEASA